LLHRWVNMVTAVDSSGMFVEPSGVLETTWFVDDVWNQTDYIVSYTSKRTNFSLYILVKDTE